MPKVATEIDVDRLVAQLVNRPPTDDVDERILDAAGALLVTEGLDGLGVDRVADASGVGRSTLYRRFQDRNTLITATIAHEARRFLAALASAVDPNDTWEDQLVTAFAAGLRVALATGLDRRVREDPHLLRLLTIDAAPVVAAARDQLVALARGDRSDAPSPPTELDAAADLLVRLAISYVLVPPVDRLGDGDPGTGLETTVRHHLRPLLQPH